MKKFFQDDEQDLIAFLRQHRSLPPGPTPHLENQVMDLINQTSQKNSQDNPLRLLKAFSGTIMVGLAVVWSIGRWSQQTPQIALDQDIIETFLMNSWEQTVSDQTALFSSPEQEIDWFFSHREETPQVLSHSQ
ncbi:MAG: hypothetical protein AAGA80_28295 [Cyanobacteria bacterium P01_F01_bin.143]